MNEAFLLLVGLCGFVWFFAPLVLILLLWSKVNRLEGELSRLKPGRRPEKRPGVADVAERRRAGAVEPGEIEMIEPLPQKPAEPARTPAGEETAQPIPQETATEPTTPESEEKQPFSLEEVLAGRWLAWVGSIAVIFGAGYFFKYTVDANLIGPTGRVVIGIVVGMAAFAGGAIAMLKKYRWLAQGLVGTSVGILYFSIFAAYHPDWYELWPQPAAFAALVAVTAAALAFSTIFVAQPTAMIGLLGGFLVPFMLSTGEDRQWELFSYIFILDLGVLGIASFRKWQPLQVTAFVLTVLMWLVWFAEHYAEEKLTATVILMTAFFLLFALLGVWHNALRKLPARPGDFFLMLATPVVYFVGLYGVTRTDFANWQGLMAIGLAALYLGLAVFQMQRNPAGKPVIVSLAGIAASFLTIAIPLQLTGHWIAVAWAAEALLLAELGLRFRMPKLRWAGFGLLLVVQLILAYYSVETFDNPARFHTRFGDVDPVAEDALPSGVIGRMAYTGPLADEREPAWTDVFNGRSLSFLASAIVLAVLAWEYGRRRESLETEESTVLGLSPGIASRDIGGVLLAMVPITLMNLLIVETFALGARFHWIGPTELALFIIWSSLAAVALAVMSRRILTAWLSRVALGVFGLTALFLLVSFVGTLGDWRSTWGRWDAAETAPGMWAWLLLNPRGVAYLIALAAAAFTALLLHRDEQDEDLPSFGTITVSQLLGVFAYLTGLALLTTEVYAQGVIREWETATSLAVTGIWTLYAIATLIVGIYYRSATVRILALLLFVVTTLKVFTYDVWHLDEKIRTVAFVLLGVSLLLVSYLYQRYRGRIRAWITTAAVLLAVGGGLMSSADAAHAAGVRIPSASVPRRATVHVTPESARLAAPLAGRAGQARRLNNRSHTLGAVAFAADEPADPLETL